MEEFILPTKKYDLTPEERGALRTFFSSMAWLKTIANARMSKPPIFPPVADAKNPESVRQANNDRLMEIRGWTLFEAALAREERSPAEPKNAPLDTYPDSGRIDPTVQPTKS